jgi:adenine-specific DNA-methyltransferase
LPETLLFPSVTRARELFGMPAGVLRDASPLRRVIDIPADLDLLDAGARRHVDAFLQVARALGGDRGYIARTRRCWWAVALREPAPILATYMARRPPAFVRNLAHARHINIAHGLYPRDPMSADALNRLAAWLATGVRTGDGRTYAGGLTKFEPREMERLLVPDLTSLASLDIQVKPAASSPA